MTRATAASWLGRWLCLGLALWLVGCGSRTTPVIRIEGQRHVRPSELTSAARRELAQFGRSDDEAALADAAYAMEEVLHRLGFAHGEVAFTRLDRFHGRPQARFDITEGPRVYLRHLTFPGATHFTNRTLHGLLEAEGVGLFRWGKPPYRLDDCERLVERVQSLYLLDGYYRVQVGSPQVTYSPDGRWADVRIPVHEGPAYTVARVTWRLELAGSGLTSTDLDPVIDATPLVGRAYFARLPTLAETALRAWLEDRGHLEAQVDHAVTIDDAHAEVLITYHVHPGPVAVLARLAITGQRRTDPWFIRHTLDLQTGQPVSRDRLDAGMTQLARSGAFTTERWHAELAPGTGTQRPTTVEVAVQEAKARTVDVELGYGTYDELIGGLRYQDRNFLGIGRYLEIHPTVSMKGYGSTQRVRDRYLLGRDNTLELSTSYLYQEMPTYNLTLLQATLSVEHRFGRRWSDRGGYTYEDEKATSIAAPVLGVDGSAYIPAPRLFDEIRFDDRDSPISPTRGTLASVQVTYSSRYLGSHLDFVEYNGQMAQFLRLGKDLVLGLDGRYITRELLNAVETLPIQERLFLGGEDSVRSYREFGLSPTDSQGVLVGGLTAAMATAELRYQIVDHLELAAFYDVGEVNIASWGLRGGAYGQGIGPGLRYLLPVGPVRLDLAYNPLRSVWSMRGWMGQAAVGFSF